MRFCVAPLRGHGISESDVVVSSLSSLSTAVIIQMQSSCPRVRWICWWMQECAVMPLC